MAHKRNLRTEHRRPSRRKRTPDPIRSDTFLGFHPLPAQRRFLQALQEALSGRQAASDTAVCAAIGISRMTLWKWRQQPGFNAWLRQELDQTSDWNWSLILARHELQAIDGNVKSAEFIWKVRTGMVGRTGGASAPIGDRPGVEYSVNILVPRPDWQNSPETSADPDAKDTYPSE